MFSHNNSFTILIIIYLCYFISSSFAQPPPPYEPPWLYPPPPTDPWPYPPPPTEDPWPYPPPPTEDPYASTVNTFDFVNSGPFNNYLKGDFGSTYRDYQTSSSNFVLSLAFYNTTPNAYFLALGVTPQYWVWEANPTDPVQEGARLSFKEDGNLVLTDVDGRLVWQTNTSNLGVKGLSTPINDQYGNLVLYGADNKPAWQSSDHPSSTLFANQLLRSTAPKRLVSRVSSLGGFYSLVLMPNRVSLYYKSANNSKPIVYYTLFKTNKTLDTLQFVAFNQFKPSFIQHFTDGTQDRYEYADLSPPPDYNFQILSSFIRVENDGNLIVHIYQKDDEDEGWYPSYSLFPRNFVPFWKQDFDTCSLPEKCGAFGVCENGSCVSCPTPQGLVPWVNGKCEPPKVGPCSLGKRVKYYKVVGVEHYSIQYNKGEGIMPKSLCQTKCSLDCKCVGYFYHLENSKCWIAHDLMTLTKSNNPKHFGFIKTSF